MRSRILTFPDNKEGRAARNAFCYSTDDDLIIGSLSDIIDFRTFYWLDLEEAQEECIKELGTCTFTNMNPAFATCLHNIQRMTDVRIAGSKIRELQLPFTPEQWYQLCTRDGAYYLGGCCGTYSYCQDLLNGAFRDSGWISARNFRDLMESMASHDGQDNFRSEEVEEFLAEGQEQELIEVCLAKWDHENFLPWVKLDLVWNTVKDHLKVEDPAAQGNDPARYEDAINIIADSAFLLNCRHIFDTEDSLQSKAETVRIMHELYPALRTVMNRLSDAGIDPVEGYAVMSGQEIYSHSRFKIFKTHEEAEQAIAAWADSPYNEHEELQFHVAHVRISFEKGLEILGR